MYKYMLSIIKKYSSIESPTQDDIDELKSHIEFIQHERLIHLIVTVLFSFIVMFLILLACISTSLSLEKSYLCSLGIGIIIVICTLFAYVVHYYHLENGVQKMYREYDLLKSRFKESQPHI